MSAQTKAAMDAAMAAHLADEMEGVILTNWYVVLCGSIMDRPDENSYWYDNADHQPMDRSVGLVKMADRYLDHVQFTEED